MLNKILIEIEYLIIFLTCKKQIWLLCCHSFIEENLVKGQESILPFFIKKTVNKNI